MNLRKYFGGWENTGAQVTTYNWMSEKFTKVVDVFPQQC